MQDNVITLAVDTANTGSTTDKDWTLLERALNRSSYMSDNHAHGSRDMFQLYRSPAKKNGEYLGTSRVSIKFTEDISVDNATGDGTIVAPDIIEVNFATPVGATPADNLRRRMQVVALLIDDSIMDDLIEKGEI